MLGKKTIVVAVCVLGFAFGGIASTPIASAECVVVDPFGQPYVTIDLEECPPGNNEPNSP